MSDLSFGVVKAKAALVSDAAYLDAARQLIQSASHYCLCTLFIVDPDPIKDTDLLVDSLLHDMACAAWRGVDARLIVGGSRSNGRILDAALLARERAQDLGLPCRLGAAYEQQSNHSKLMVADNACLSGSHNWSPGAFKDQTQDSLLVEDEALAAYFASHFDEQWNAAGEEGFDVPR